MDRQVSYTNRLFERVMHNNNLTPEQFIQSTLAQDGFYF